MASRFIRVFVADAYPIIRNGLITTIEAEPQMSVVGSGEYISDFTTGLAPLSVDVVVINFVGMHQGLVDGIRKFRRTHRRLGLVVVASDVDFAPELLAIGIHAYSSYAEPDEQLHLAIRAAKARQRFVSPLVQDYLDRYTTIMQTHRFVPRELQIIKYIAQGLSGDEIAKCLDLNYFTVLNYVSSIRRKGGWTTWPQIVSWYNMTYGHDFPRVAHKSAR